VPAELTRPAVPGGAPLAEVFGGTGRKTGPSGPRENTSLYFHVPPNTSASVSPLTRCRLVGPTVTLLSVMAGTPLKLIVGLGNPDPEYARTRHNAGFWFADELARRHGGSFRFETKHQGELARVRIGGHEIWLLKPMTYMNRSGGPTRSVATFYKMPAEEILVAHDELDFPPGIVKLRQGGGAAGNNGIKDLIAQIGDAFWRFRIGVGKPPATGIDHVLSRPSATEERLIRECVNDAADAVPVILEQGGQRAMNGLHTRAEPPAES
jgi:PTH1 family peptidyl-tRNA hydrolase